MTVAYARGEEGGSGVNSSPLKILKEMKTTLFGTNRLFHTKIAEIALMFFRAIKLAYKISKNLHCDAIIGLPVVNQSTNKVFWRAALDVDNCRKSETFIFSNEPMFLRGELAEIAVMSFCLVQLSNLISRNFHYHAMHQYRYSNFSDTFCLNCIFVIDAAVKQQLVSRSFLKYDVSAVTMAAHKIKRKNQIFTVGLLVSLSPGSTKV